MTMAFIGIDVVTGEGFIVNAGHCFPYKISIEGVATPLPKGGYRLGHSFDSSYACMKFAMSPGDSLFLFTDGLVENSSSDGKMIEQKALKQVLEKSTPETLKANIVSLINETWQSHPYQDDVSFLIATWET